MNHNQTKDWRVIAHEEYENRKDVEFELAKVRESLKSTEEALTATNNYNNILIKKQNELEAKCNEQAAKLLRGIELLRNAKLLFTKHKQQIDTLTQENIVLREEIAKKTALLEAEVTQHSNTNNKLVQSLSKLAAATAVAITHPTALAPPPKEKAVSHPQM